MQYELNTTDEQEIDRLIEEHRAMEQKKGWYGRDDAADYDTLKLYFKQSIFTPVLAVISTYTTLHKKIRELQKVYDDYAPDVGQQYFKNHYDGSVQHLTEYARTQVYTAVMKMGLEKLEETTTTINSLSAAFDTAVTTFNSITFGYSHRHIKRRIARYLVENYTEKKRGDMQMYDNIKDDVNTLIANLQAKIDDASGTVVAPPRTPKRKKTGTNLMVRLRL